MYHTPANLTFGPVDAKNIWEYKKLQGVGAPKRCRGSQKRGDFFLQNGRISVAIIRPLYGRLHNHYTAFKLSKN